MKNSVSLIGHLGTTPELRSVGDGQVCTFRLATSRTWRTTSGERKEAVEWHSIEVWDGQARSCSQYLAKGDLVGVDGRLQTDEWTDKGSNQKRSRTKVVALTVHFLRTKGGGHAEQPGDAAGEGPEHIPAFDDEP